MRALASLLGLVAVLGSAALSRPAEAQPRSRSRARMASSAYRQQVQRWHTAARVPEARTTPDGRFVLRLVSINSREAAEVTPRGPDGGFDEAARADVARVLGDSRTHQTHPIDRRLIDILYGMARHFQVGQVNVVSGYRAEANHSNHALGRAVDVVLPGVRDAQVAEWARGQGFVGVGVYPSSGFVHIDVRNHSFFWVDRSAPARTVRRSSNRRRRRRGSLHPILGTLAQQADRDAAARGVRPLGGTDRDVPEVSAGADDTDDE